jgi:hypothetical protein
MLRSADIYWLISANVTTVIPTEAHLPLMQYFAPISEYQLTV